MKEENSAVENLPCKANKLVKPLSAEGAGGKEERKTDLASRISDSRIGEFFFTDPGSSASAKCSVESMHKSENAWVKEKEGKGERKTDLANSWFMQRRKGEKSPGPLMKGHQRGSQGAPTRFPM